MESIEYKSVCPICGSKGVVTTLGEEGKLAKTINPDTQMAMFIFKGNLIDPTLANQYLMGTTIANYSMVIDTCSNPDCGVLFALRLVVGEQTKIPKIVLPSSGVGSPGKQN